MHECRFAKEHEGEYDWVRKNEGHKGVQVLLLLPSSSSCWQTCCSYVVTILSAGLAIHDGRALEQCASSSSAHAWPFALVAFSGRVQLLLLLLLQAVALQSDGVTALNSIVIFPTTCSFSSTMRNSL